MQGLVLTRKYAKGFTYVELMVSLVLIGLLASIIVPVTSVISKQQKERELKIALLEIRTAIDAYKLASDRNEISEQYKTESGYPPNLKVLMGVPNKYNENKVIRFLRNIPRDPFNDQVKDPELSWGLRSYESEALDPKDGKDVYDIYPLSNDIGLNGVAYRLW
ncbi:type II secretion system protein [Acinetobacter haemolyticus]|uniref:type II secretion system protein n=1 Tax=Acinetobacter haemolyticus TaxID=29430 RepID=UPI0024DE4033|nr:type II secretion system protein [Acinetobacter haemolyticus]